MINTRGCFTVLLLAAAILGPPGCTRADLGKPCPGLLGDVDPGSGTTRTETAATVGQSTCFP